MLNKVDTTFVMVIFTFFILCVLIYIGLIAYYFSQRNLQRKIIDGENKDKDPPPSYEEATAPPTYHVAILMEKMNKK